MNRISEQMKTGTIGELLVQARLLQYDVQAAPPLKDSGNDLIAIRGKAMRAVQVKTRRTRGEHCDIDPTRQRRFSFDELATYKLTQDRVDQLFPQQKGSSLQIRTGRTRLP